LGTARPELSVSGFRVMRPNRIENKVQLLVMVSALADRPQRERGIIGIARGGCEALATGRIPGGALTDLFYL